ncbi:hypothetical protein ACOSP6_13165 [Tenacibaculum sp. MEBiC06402]|uniref:hypothetical protein n=1 Tax=unclassified Tenacibaculum TaxID=2635139 RepID=UPI003B9ABF3E
MRVGRFLVNIISFVFIANTNHLFAQADFSSKQIIDGVAVFRDTSDPLLFYYEPGDLQINLEDNGKPNFKFLDLRYTGSKCYDDAGEKSFMSLVQFEVTMKKIASKTLQKLKSSLKKYGRVTLRPLPITQIDTRLVLPVENNNQQRHQVIENDGALEANDNSGFNSSNSFWTKRTYTVRLNKYESQLLATQLKEKLLGINLNYVYRSQVWMPNEEEITGSKEIKEQFEKDSIHDESNNIQNRIIKSNTLTINIDTKKFPDILKQIDLNEGIPPTYAAIEVKCYDFKENLRPELYMKTVEIEATSVNNGKKISVKSKFRKKYIDLYTQHINFPYAIDMNSPMRYRITEINTNGERTISDWINKPECNSVIDITSTKKEQKIINNTIDIEVNSSIFVDETISKLEFKLYYSLQGKAKTKTILFSKDDEFPLQSMRFLTDKESLKFYTITKHLSEEETPLIGKKIELKENYIYLNSL